MFNPICAHCGWSHGFGHADFCPTTQAIENLTHKTLLNKFETNFRQYLLDADPSDFEIGEYGGTTYKSVDLIVAIGMGSAECMLENIHSIIKSLKLEADSEVFSTEDSPNRGALWVLERLEDEIGTFTN